jgi:hypothetical protein
VPLALKAVLPCIGVSCVIAFGLPYCCRCWESGYSDQTWVQTRRVWVSTRKLYPSQMEMWWAEGKAHICQLVLMSLEMEACNYCCCFIHSLSTEISMTVFFWRRWGPLHLYTKLSKIWNGSYVPKVMSNFFLHATWEQQTKESMMVGGTSCCVNLQCLVTSIACLASLDQYHS